MIDKSLTLANQYDIGLYFKVIEKVKEAIFQRTDLNDQFSDNITLLMTKFPDFKQVINISSEKFNIELNSSQEVNASDDENKVNKGILFSKTRKS